MNIIIEKLKLLIYLIMIKVLLFIRPWRKQRDNTIVFVVDYVKPRVIKIGYALKKKHYRVVLFLNDDSKESLAKDNKKYFDKIIPFKSEIKLYMNCLFVKPLVYHIFSEADVKVRTENLIKNKKNIGKIVYDQYDVFKDFSRYKNRACERREKFCFENADGICCRSFETQHLKHKYGYSFAKRILFFDYCWNWNYLQEDQSNDKGRKNLKIIYGGRLLSSRSQDVLEKIEWDGFSYMASVLERSKGYFVIVPSRKCDAAYYKFLDLEKKNKFVKIKNPMSLRKLLQYESHMDYGIDCVEFQSKTDEYVKMFGYVYDYKSKARYYATNKYFDYVDAGIPALYGRKNEMFGRYLARYGAAIPCSLEELPEKLEWLEKNKEINKEKAKRAREILAIENQIDRLIKFYHQL